MRRARLALGSIALVSAVTVALPGATASPAQVIVTPMADAFVNDQQPETNYGYLDWLRTEASTKQSVSYLRFDVPPLTEAIETATLRVFAERNSPIGYDVRRVADNSWDELTITYSTAPPVGNVVDSSGAFDRGTWTSVDVTPLVTGGGELTVAMTTAEPGRMTRYSSREAGLTSPQLVVSVATGDGDAVAPTTPTQLSATAQMSGGVTLSWLPSTDDVGVTGYTIYRDGGRLATVGATLTTYADISVAPLTSYSYTVDAFDGAGNHSAQSIPALVTTPAAVGDPVITAAGDICGGCEATAVLVEAIDPTYALTLGDNQYSDGALSEYLADYDRSWGRFKSETYPAPGNHDWHTANAQGYRDYFGTRADPDGDGNTWYSWNVGNWHLISLDSDCGDVGGCGAGSPQYEWLAADLLADAHQCTLAYWHHPRFSSGTTHGGRTSVQPFWELLYDEGAEIVLSGHEHNYERFGPQSPTGEADPEGITEFVVGTGGAGHYPFGNPEPNSLVRNATTSGVLKLALHTRSYDFQFVSVAGEGFTDSGSGSCS